MDTKEAQSKHTPENLSANSQVKIHSELVEKLNFACYHSSFSFVRELRIENQDAKTALVDLQVSMSATPEFLQPKAWHLDRIAPNRTGVIEDLDVELTSDYFRNLTDSVPGNVIITVTGDGKVLGEQTVPIELLAYNEWGGAGYMPSLLASFCIPNDPAVDQVLRDASLILRKAGKADGIDGYTTKSRTRVWEIASAIYTAILNLNLSYAVPPASFERDGQKIRLPSQILNNRLATCLDTTMLFASALEQANLQALVVMPEGHALVGVWLQPESLADVVTDDAEVLRKRIQLNELILIETTLVTKHPTLPFSQAVETAKKLIAADKDDTFHAAVDITLARNQQIKPLGLANDVAVDLKKAHQNDEAEIGLEEAPSLPDFDQGVEEEQIPDTPLGRLEKWKRKLLDLSARNPLLNHRSVKTSLQIICPDPGQLEDTLATGVRIAIKPVPKLKDKTQNNLIDKQNSAQVIDADMVREALTKKTVLVDLSEEELALRVVKIYRKAQTALQEGGANTLYLGLGFLLWKQNKKAQRRNRAPLILLPVTLERKSVRSGIKMLRHDDDARFNTTLLELLRKDFAIDIRGLDQDLPEDDSGIDVKDIWNKVRRAVKDAPGFEVVEDVVLGHFSFAKYLMWQDMCERNDALRDSAIVKHLLDTPRKSYECNIPFVEANQVDRNFLPADLLTPLPSDSSQLAAIATADRGKDFVLIGPPGTGKSQTISNMIAHLLGKGKTVLFVSEKIAALSVVHQRLEKIGLGRFCLELHSNKASKKDVMKQLRAAWTSPENGDVEQIWTFLAEQLRGKRDTLNRVVERLHVCYRNGLTPHFAIGKKIKDEQLAEMVTFDWQSADTYDATQLENIREIIRKLEVQDPPEDADIFANLVARTDWSPQWESQLVNSADELAKATDELISASDELIAAIEIATFELSPPQLASLKAFAKVLLISYRKQISYALEPFGHETFDYIEDAVARVTEYTKLTAKLSCPYEPEAWRKLDGEEISHRWQKAQSSKLLIKLFLRFNLVKHMRLNGAQGKPDPAVDGPLLGKLREEGKVIDDLDEQLSFFNCWTKHNTKPDAVAILVELRKLGKQLLIAVNQLADDENKQVQIRSKVKLLIRNNNELLAPDAPVGQVATRYLKAYQAFQNATASFAKLGGKSVGDNFQTLDKLQAAMKGVAQRRAELNSWCSWLRRRNKAIDQGLAPLIEAFEEGHIRREMLVDTFEAAYCTWWSGEVIGEDEILRNFSTPEHTALINNYREIDNKFQDLTVDYIKAKVLGKLTAEGDVTRKSTWGILKRELQKKKGHKSVRRLINEIPDVVSTLTPCLMMSPLSVAQYLPAKQDQFDVVIFDEASQITVWDAIGALARGKQVIIAGDPKQMPPTNFFTRTDDDPDGDNDAEVDLESILDEMLGSSIPQLDLNLHYRSRRESLITFSNHRYYDDKLVTFPAPVQPDQGVKLIEPDGFYARGGARHNEGEAKAIVAEIVRRLTHEDENVRKQSIGVVTFNTEQQSLIEDLLDKARSEDPNIEWAFAPNSELETVFVKNLETVQGDERDVILFSITYGPDRNGRTTMNFGPLNRDGGERRLNVAMTRARSEMIVYSTLDPDMIDLTRTKSRAVKDLKDFLRYAKSGPAVLGSMDRGTVGDFDSPFESAVASALKDSGFEVHPQVGVSAYRIDLGVVHPDKKGVYLAGVECDGAMYHSSAVARERDKIRQAVLEDLGWTLFRVWSTDWWINRAGALKQLRDSLDACLKADRANSANQQQVAKSLQVGPDGA